MVGVSALRARRQLHSSLGSLISSSELRPLILPPTDSRARFNALGESWLLALMLSLGACALIFHFFISHAAWGLFAAQQQVYRSRRFGCGKATGGGVLVLAWRACTPKPTAEAQRHEHGVRTNRLGSFSCFFLHDTCRTAMTPSVWQRKTQHFLARFPFRLCSILSHSSSNSAKLQPIYKESCRNIWNFQNICPNLQCQPFTDS